MTALAKIWQIAIAECAGAVRSRRALVTILLYLVLSVLSMNGTISADLPEDKVAESGKMQLTDFVDPAVAEPFILIQAQFDENFAEEGR